MQFDIKWHNLQLVMYAKSINNIPTNEFLEVLYLQVDDWEVCSGWIVVLGQHDGVLHKLCGMGVVINQCNTMQNARLRVWVMA